MSSDKTIEPIADYPFYMIFSSRTIDDLSALIKEHYDKVSKETNEKLKPSALIVPDKFKNQPTFRTIVVIDEKVYESLKEDESNIEEFKIDNLRMKKHFYPKAMKNETYNFYLSLPQNLTLEACQKHLMERLNALRTYKIWDSKDDYKINIHSMDRLKNTHGGKAYIHFTANDDNLDKIVLTRLFINDTKWPGTNLDVNCYWARKRTEESKDANNKQTDSVTTKVINGNSKVNPNIWEEKKNKHS